MWHEFDHAGLDPGHRFADSGAASGQLAREIAERAAAAPLPATSTSKRESVSRVGVFNIVDDEPAPVREWVPYLAQCAGAKPPRRISTWVVRPLAGEMMVAMMTQGHGFSNAKAKRELGWRLRYPSWRDGFRAEFA